MSAVLKKEEEAVMSRYRDLGLQTKLKFVNAGGRAESVGLHCVVTSV